jgi:hypothetical protein
VASLRDRFFTRRTAEVIMAPSSIVLAGAATAVGIVAGAPVAAAAAIGAGVYAGWVALRMPRGPQKPADGAIDLHRLRDPWRWYVKEALESRARFRRAVASASAGPLKDRLTEIGNRLDDGVAECWRIANRGQELEAALAQLVPVEQTMRRIAELQAAPPSDTTASLIEALRSQADSYQRIARTATDARNRLQVLEVRLDEAVARAVELSLQAADVGALHGLGNDVNSLVGEMEALRRGLEIAEGLPQAGQVASGGTE